MRRLTTRRITIAAVLAAAGLLAAACGSSGTGGSGGGGNGTSGTLTIADESGGTWSCAFNPFLSNDESFGFGPVYEPLMFVNNLAATATAPGGLANPTPWLATKATWNSANTQLTFTIRSGVKWNDGTPMTSADVAYTFNVMNTDKALDLQSLWSNVGGPITSVVAQGSNVVVTMNKPSPLYFYNIADQVPIVPEHIWSKIPTSQLVTFNDPKPVGTGAYEVQNCSANNIEYTANTHYYQAGEPKIKTVNYPAYLSNPPCNAALAAGTAQWGSQYITDIQTAYLAKSPNFHTYSPPTSSVSLVINLKSKTAPELANVKVRQAMAYAINRSAAAESGEGGEEPPSNQTDIVSTQDDGPYGPLLDASQAAKFGNDYAYNPTTAKNLLIAAGYNKIVGGVRQNSAGQALSFTVVNNGGFSDWISTLQNVVVPELAAVGIQVKLENLASTAYEDALETGAFQLGYFAQNGGPGPLYEFRQWLFSGNSAKIGQDASTNYERYYSTATDALINQYQSTPLADIAFQKAILNKLQLVMLKDVPIIPITGEVDWYQYDTQNITGWPTKTNMYAQPAQYAIPDWGQVLMHLAPKSS